MLTFFPFTRMWPCRIIWRAWAREAPNQPVDDVVEAALEDLHQVLARVAGLRDRLVEVAAELALHHAVHLLGALHFAQADAELAQPARLAPCTRAACFPSRWGTSGCRNGCP